MSIVIGRFKPSKQGGWDGEIQTLTMSRKVQFIPNDDRVSEDAPDYRLMLEWQRIGDAWTAKGKGNPPRDVLRVCFDDLLFTHVRKATLWPSEDGNSARLIFDRRFQ